MSKVDDDLFIESRLDGDRSICISTLARQTVEDAEVGHLGGDRGYFIYEVDRRPAAGGINILAKVASVDAAMRLADLWREQRARAEA